MATVTVHALDGGHITLPERLFVTPNDPEAKRAVPSLCFLIQHHSQASDQTTRIIFDLGLRRDLELYPPTLRKHCEDRAPINTRPDVTESLARGNLTVNDIDYIVLSHVHYDHIGYPKDFDNPQTKFIIGPGANDVLSGKLKFHGSHSTFEPDLLPAQRTVELPPPSASSLSPSSSGLNLSSWAELPPFPAAIDIFSDGTVFILDAPGHLPGHINMLVQLSTKKYALLAGDSAHDMRLFHGTHDIATWTDDQGNKCCIHADIPQAKETIARLKEVSDNGIDVETHLGAHADVGRELNKGIGKYMDMGGGKQVEIQRGWFGDPKAQDVDLDPGRRQQQQQQQQQQQKTQVRVEVEVVFAHNDVWEEDAKKKGRFWPGQL